MSQLVDAMVCVLTIFVFQPVVDQETIRPNAVREGIGASVHHKVSQEECVRLERVKNSI